MRRLLIAALLGGLLGAPAFAADAENAAPTPVLTPASLAAAAASAATSANTDTAPMFIRHERPRMLPALYLTAASLQGYDVYSTFTALKSGAQERNPVMKGLVGNPAAFVAVKAGVAGASIIAAEQLWRGHHRTSAVMMMLASNILMGAVVHHNAGVLNRMP